MSADFEPSTKARRRFVARAVSWAKGAAAMLGSLGGTFTVEPMERGAALRAENPGVRFVLVVDRRHLELSLELDGAALDAFALALQQDATMRAIASLPEQFFFRRATSETRASALGREAFTAAIDAAREDRAALRIGWRLPRNVVLTRARLVDEQLVDALRALAVVEIAVAARPARGGPLAVAASSPFSPLASSHAGAKSRALGVAFSPRARLATTGSMRLRARASSARPRIEARRNGIDAGARVRVLAGPFEGKIGVVHTLDGDVARVLFGLLATRVDLADLAPAHIGDSGSRGAKKRIRPAIATSHRRSP